MEKDDNSAEDFAAEFDNIDCPSWINFDEENYEPREADVRWFASLQPHLRTPECIIKAEKLESDEKDPIVDISNTPNVKQRRRPKTNPSKLLSNKLQFSSSDDEEIYEMLKAHNKRIQHKSVKVPISNDPSACTIGQSDSNVVPEREIAKVTSSIVTKNSKRRSCAPLMKKNKSSRCTRGLPGAILNTASEPSKVNAVGVLCNSAISPKSDHIKSTQVSASSQNSCESSLAKVTSSTVPKNSKRRSCAPLMKKNKSSSCTRGFPGAILNTASEPSKVNAVEVLCNSAISPKSDHIKSTQVLVSSQNSCESSLSKTTSSSKVLKPHQTRPGAKTLKQPAVQKTLNAMPSKTRVVQKSNSTMSSAAKTKSFSTSKVGEDKSATQNNSAKPTKALATTRPVIKSTVSKRPLTSNSSVNKVSSSSVVSKAQSAKVTLPNKKVPCKKDMGRMKPNSQMHSRSGGPFGASSNVMSIINSKTPGKERLKSKGTDVKPRYSVETPSPPRTANCESSDDEDLDAFITRQLKAHNAKVEAKMIANNRISGKATKTGRKVTLHLGSPSRPKMKPVRHKE